MPGTVGEGDQDRHERNDADDDDPDEHGGGQWALTLVDEVSQVVEVLVPHRLTFARTEQRVFVGNAQPRWRPAAIRRG